MTKTIGFIGSGMIGSSLARLAVAAGLDVVMSNSRGPETLADLVAQLGDRAHAVTTEEAAKAGDVVVATVPMSAYDKLPADALAGKTVIDTMNYYPERDGRIAELDSAEVTSSELLQRHLANSRVVKTLHNMDHRRLFRAGLVPPAPRTAAPCPSPGTTRPPRPRSSGFWTSWATTPSTSAHLPTPGAASPAPPVYVWPYLGDRPEGITKEEAQRWFQEAPGEPVPADGVKELVDQAVRGPVGGSFAALPFWG
ncbi:NADPH-dependent F420 reductase [Streptomyces dangxiongensis]|uniref:NADPH-dependent F420 reductase n=1 Tax=Streptomyces dangxiongensis TaxID=1442032 RepID=UPI0026B7717B